MFLDPAERFDQCWQASCTATSVSAKDIVLRVAETLPDDATVLDAINDLELLAALNEGSMEALSATNVPRNCEPAWLYESPSRLSAVRHQNVKSR
jgi:hypothetical protein